MPMVVASPVHGAVAQRLRGFGPLGTTSFIAIALVGPVLEPFTGVLVLLWVTASQTPWRDIGYAWPASWFRTVSGGLTFGILFKLGMKILVMPLLGAPPINPAYHYLAGNVVGVAGMVLYVCVVAGFSEETLFRGFLFERLGTLLGSSAAMKALIVVTTSAWFAIAHYPDQGVPGVEQAVVTGMVFGTMFARTGRIWTPMVAHIAFDLTALVMIYLDIESPIAHLVFK